MKVIYSSEAIFQFVYSVYLVTECTKRVKNSVKTLQERRDASVDLFTVANNEKNIATILARNRIDESLEDSPNSP